MQRTVALYIVSKICGRFDNGKPPVHLIPSSALLQVAEVLQHGAKKYGEWNWTEGFNWNRLIGAVERHILAWKDKDKDDKDSDSGISHLAHACCNLMFLLTLEEKGIGEDDRKY